MSKEEIRQISSYVSAVKTFLPITIERKKAEAEDEAIARHKEQEAKQRQDAGNKSGEVRQRDAEKWRSKAREFLKRGGEETLPQMAQRIHDMLLEDGWVTKAEWKHRSKSERSDPETGYVPSVDEIVRFLRNPTKSQLQ